MTIHSLFTSPAAQSDVRSRVDAKSEATIAAAPAKSAAAAATAAAATTTAELSKEAPAN